jgi:pimeloyl-ACP methyl ester carboxylesterase
MGGGMGKRSIRRAPSFMPADLGKIACPTLVMHGDRDEFFPVKVPMAMHQAIPGSQLCILPGAGHGLPWNTNPSAFADILLAFLEQHPMAPRNSRHG